MPTATLTAFSPPAADEYLPYYARYIDRVTDGDLLSRLTAQLTDVPEFFRAVPADRGELRYAPGKWSIKETVGHLADVERVMAYRALRIARDDATPLAGFDENAYVPAANFDRRSMESLVEEWSDVRWATLALFRSLDAEAAARRGVANSSPVTVRALAYIIAGHTEHHLEIVQTKYLGD